MILVIGYGNPLCGDDGLGPSVAEQLALDMRNEVIAGTAPFVDCRAVFQLTPELAEPISYADAVIFIDAEYGAPAGEITRVELPVEARPPEETPGAFSHHVSPLRILESARLLYGRRPPATLYTIKGGNFGLGDPVSAAIEEHLPELMRDLVAKVNECTSLALQRQ